MEIIFYERHQCNPMANPKMMARGLVSILITIVLFLAFFTGLEGGDDEGGGGHVLWAYVLVLLFLVHLVLNYKTFIFEMRSLFKWDMGRV